MLRIYFVLIPLFSEGQAGETWY